MTSLALCFQRGFIRLGRLTGVHPRFRSGQFTAVGTGNPLLRLFMTRFTRLLFAFQSCLTGFKAGFRFQRTFRFQIDSAQFGFFLTVILHQRNIARADIGAGTTFDAVIDMVRAGFIVVATLAVPVELLRQQFGRTGVGTGRTTDAGLFFLVVSHLSGRWRKNTVGDLHHRHIQRWQGEAHQWPAHDDHLSGRSGKADMMQQMTDWRTQTTPDVSRLGDRLAGQRHHPFGNGFTVDDCPLHGPGRTDVLHQYADIGRASAVRHFFAGQNAGQLFGTARGVFGRDNPNLQVALAAQRLLQRSDRFRFIILNADQHPLSLQYPGKDAAALQHLSGVILHQAIVGGDIRLALRRVNNQGVNPAQATLQFGGGGEARTAQARHARIVNTLHNVRTGMLAVVRQRVAWYPAILTIGRQKNAEF